MDPDPYLNVLSQILIAVPAASDLITVYAPSIGGIVAIVIALIALGVSAFVSGSETAYFSLTDSDVESVEDENLRERIEKILSKPQILLATILITNNLVNVSIVILLNYAFSEIFVFHSDVADFIFKSVILTFLLLLFGEILPKLYSNNHSLKWAKFAVSGITLLSRIFAPVSKLMAMSTSVVNKVVTKKSDDLSLDDLSHALEITEVNEEKTMLKEILKFGGKTVSEVMTPRVDITDVEWDTTFNQLPTEAGWGKMQDGLVLRFHEYGSVDANGNAIDLSKRSLDACSPAAGSDNPVLTAEEAAGYTIGNVFGEWNPQTLTVQLAAPEVVIDEETNTLSWNAVPEALGYAIVKDGSVVAFTTASSFSISELGAGTYSIRVANEMGGLGEASNTTTDISSITVDGLDDNAPIYNVSGVRVGNDYKGVVIQKGKKFIKK